MQNYTPGNQTEVAQFVARRLPHHSHFVLGTTDDTGEPWVVYLGLAFDDELNVIWLSKKNTEHSRHLREHSIVSIGIFSKTKDSGDFGLYCKATAQEVNDEEELKKLLPFYFAPRGKSVPGVTSFLGNGDTRAYKATITEAWVNDDSHVKTAVDLNELRARTWVK